MKKEAHYKLVLSDKMANGDLLKKVQISSDREATPKGHENDFLSSLFKLCRHNKKCRFKNQYYTA
ncbi:hypothetical protein ORD22_09415 [Sporosarcina sp. GW1-11]|uniref:hypothetical protein n=1 Tax=Sporosarcina sp. GW1-11 TaxID=2899126 RepID=UPI00294ED3E0|nr:hypothetical protein [Sporosarcina sp. GW1-11]MDV6378443.1 hypothetical protein [Sporosarcina sp. GW1-11]